MAIKTWLELQKDDFAMRRKAAHADELRQNVAVLESQLSVLTEKTEIMKIATLILTNEIHGLSLDMSYEAPIDSETGEGGVNHVTIRFSFKD